MHTSQLSDHSYSQLPDLDYNFHSEDNMYEPFQSEHSEELRLDYNSNAGWFRMLNFAYPWLHLRKHITNQITIEHLPRPLTSENSQPRASRMFTKLTTNHPSIRRLLLSQFKWEFFVCSVLVVVDFMVKLANSLLMGHIIRLLTTDDQKTSSSYLIGCFFSLLFVGIYTKLWVFQYCSELGAKLRFSLTYLISMKTMVLSNFTLHQYGLGRAMNLVSNDFNDLDNGLVWVIQLFMLPINLSAATYALWQSFQFYSIIGLVVLVLSLKLQDAISKTVKQPIKQKNKISDRRIFLCKQLIKNIKSVKMYVWETSLLNMISDLRKKQMELNFNIMLSQGISKMLSYFGLMISVLCMVLAKVIFQVSQLQRDSIYASIGIFSVIRNTNFNGGLNYFTSLNIIMDRVDQFLQLEHIKARSIQRISYTTKVSAQVQTEAILISAKVKLEQTMEHHTSDIVYVFRKDEQQKSVRKLGKLNLAEHRRIFIYGLSGSGKTSFLEAFLNESPFYKIQNLKGTLSYVPQQPVLFQGTVKDNITFGSAWDEQRFNKVVSACCLDKDIQRFADGADAKVSMQGSSFSGGQRARIALARALYSRAQIVLFDNCLSALDPKVKKEVHQHLFSQMFKDKIFIYATNSEHQVLPDSFFIHIVDKKIKYFDPFREGALPAGARQQQLLQVKQEDVQQKILPVEIQNALQDQSGTVSKQTYLAYIGQLGQGNKGYFKLAVVVAIFICCEVAVLIFYKRLPLLGDSTWQKLKQIGNYLTMYICLDYLRMYVMVVLACTNSLNCHDKFIQKIAYAQYSWFFKKQPQLVNVFSNHVGIIDRPLPSVVYDVVKGLLSNFVYIMSLCIVTPAFIPLAILLGLGFWGVKYMLRLYIRKCKLFQLKFRAPVYNQLAQIFAGSTVIRAFQCQRQFVGRLRSLVYNSQKTYFAFIKMNRFFDLILELIVFLMIVLGVTFTMLFNESVGHKSGSLALSVFTLISMTGQLSFNIRQSLNLELNFISLEKLLSYRDTPTQDLTPPQNQLPALSGDIVFKNVKLKFPGSTNYCLNGLNMTIKQGEKVALMGRTGAGKSSVFLALYRLFDVEPESLITIGGRDINTLDLYTLRKKCLSSSVQDPVKLLPLTTDSSPTQLKYNSIVDGDPTPIKCLDQPFANIDSNLQQDIWKHIIRMRTVLAVVHSGNLQRWDRILILQDGRIARDMRKQDKQQQEAQQQI